MFFLHLFMLLPSFSFAQSPWILSSPGSLPEDLRLIPAVGNGHIATQVYHDTIYVNNVYNGYGNDSHRSRVPSSVAIQIAGDYQEMHELNMYTGTFTREGYESEYKIEQRIYAHRSRPTILVNEVEISRLEGEQEIQVEISNNIGEESEDMDLVTLDYDDDTWFTFGSILEPEFDDDDRPSTYQYWSKVPESLVLMEEEDAATWYFITSLSVDEQDAMLGYQQAVDEREDLWQEHADRFAYYTRAEGDCLYPED